MIFDSMVYEGKAIKIFWDKFNCSQAVLGACAEELGMTEELRMPGAMCGLWGICGAITSVGAALSIIDGTGPLSNDGTWGKHII